MDILEKYYLELDAEERELLILVGIEMLRGLINSGFSNHITVNIDKETKTHLRLIIEQMLRTKFEQPNISSNESTVNSSEGY